MYEAISCVICIAETETTHIVHPHMGGACNFKNRERKRYLFTDMKLSPGYIYFLIIKVKRKIESQSIWPLWGVFVLIG